MKLYTKKFAAALFTIFIAGVSQMVTAQEVQFSQFYASSLYLNPALAGVENDFTVNSNFRSQWISSSSSQITTQLSAIMPLYASSGRKGLMGGVGLGLFTDGSGAGGAMRQTGFRASYAYSFGLDNDLHRFSFGAQAGFTQRNIDANAQWGSQYDNGNYNPNLVPDNVGVNNRVSHGVFNLGAFWSFNPARNYYRAGTSGYSGIAIGNLNRPNVSLTDNGTDQLPVVIKYHGGLELHGTRKLNFGPQVLVAATQGHGNQINAGISANYKLIDNPFGLFGNTDLLFSGWYRVGNGVIAAVGISNATYTLGFSYDLTTSSLSNYNNGNGAYEISFSIRNAKDKRRRRFDTPRI
ncbi:MAG: PorP/SprF family type IX secretion system membrane protein [Flexibacteraceae bacterium]